MPAGAARRPGRPGRGPRGGYQRRRPAPARRSTEATSRYASSGALSRSPRRRARARSPSGPSSPRAVARTLASTTITIGAQRRYRRLQRNRTSRATTRPVKDLLKGRLAGLLDEPGPQVLLEGLVRGSCALAQDGMSLLGHIFDLHARHGAIMALEAPVRKRAVIGMSGHLKFPSSRRAAARRIDLFCAPRLPDAVVARVAQIGYLRASPRTAVTRSNRAVRHRAVRHDRRLARFS